MAKKSWVDEVTDRSKSADNICAVIELIYNSLGKSIDEDIKSIEFTDEIPSGLDFKQDLKKKFKNLVKLCDKYGEYSEAKFEEEMEAGIVRAEKGMTLKSLQIPFPSDKDMLIDGIQAIASEKKRFGYTREKLLKNTKKELEKLYSELEEVK